MLQMKKKLLYIMQILSFKQPKGKNDEHHQKTRRKTGNRIRITDPVCRKRRRFWRSCNWYTGRKRHHGFCRPIMDGSFKYFVEAIEKVGITAQEADRDEYIVKQVITYVNEETGSEITLIPADEYQVTTMVDFGTKILGTQNAYLNKISEFKTEIADARTFSFLHELEALLDHGLIKGGDLNNAIVYVDKEISDNTMQKLKKVFKNMNT